MKKHSSLKRILAVCLSLVMVLSLIPGTARAAGSNRGSVSFEKIDPSEVSVDLRGGGFKAEKIDLDSDNTFKSTDRVRVMIVMPGEAAISLVDEGMSASDPAVEAYRENLRLTQEYAAEVISEEALGGEELDVVWNLTLAVNAISANVEYGQIKDIAKVNGVKAVYLERRYDPMTSGEADLNNIPAQNTTGAAALKTNGYTGAGMRIAVIDTGTAQHHQSFDAGAFEYSLEQQAKAKGMTLDAYKETLHLLTEEDVEAVASQLHAYDNYWYYDEGDFYINSKLPFGFNYIDQNLNISHIAGLDDNGNRTYEEHGSHVAGIAAANSYIPNPDGNGYVDAAETVGVTGVAPDAQIITMKVFGANGGAYSSDNFAAIEDAMVLDCDVVNLSLGSSGGFVTARGEYRFVQGEPDLDEEDNPFSIDSWINGIMDDITEHGIIMVVSAGNSGNWAEGDNYKGALDPPYDATTVGYGMMYTDEGGTYNVGSPSTFHNTMSVASADNVGSVSQSKTTFTGNGSVDLAIYSTTSQNNPDWIVMDENDGEGTEYEVVFLGDPSTGFAAGQMQANTDETIFGGYDEDDEPIGSEALEGKIVMISRGTSSFFEKRDAAAAYGAVAVICYNHTPGDGVVSADLTGTTSDIPFGGLSYEDGKAVFDICEKNEDGLYACKATVYGSLYINYGEEGAMPGMSSYSSWGTTGALTIKPEITAPGGSIYSVNGGHGMQDDTSEYENMSGTSMAAPHFSGLVALTQQYIRNENVLEKAKAVAGDSLTERQLAQSLLMSTADPLVEYTDRYGNEMLYSVRNQGAGLANVQKATSAKSFILVDTAGTQDGKVKAELGDGKTPWTFTFTLYNLTNVAQRYVLSADMMTTGTAASETDYFSTNQMVPLDAEVTFSTGSTVTVPASGSVAVTATVTVSQTAVNQMKRLGYSNGFYVEGYVYATSADIAKYDLNGDHAVNVRDAQALMDCIIQEAAQDHPELAGFDLDSDGELTTRDVNLLLDLLQNDLGTAHSIPMLGWYGNWTDISMFDGDSFLDGYYAFLTGKATRLPHVTNFYPYAFIRNILMMTETGEDPEDPEAAEWYSGNIYEGNYWGDSRYIPARNALNNTDETSWLPTWFSPMLMRNAAAARVQVVGSDGTEYYSKVYDEPFEGAYAHGSLGVLIPTDEYTLTPIEYDFSNIPANTDVTISFSYAPEYYENADGSIRWNELGKGATMSFPFTIDNAGPELVFAQASGSELIVVAKDNNYVAFMAAMDGSGSAFVDLPVCPDMEEDQRGQATVVTFDISDLSGNKAIVALCDYAGNESFYKVNLTNGEYAGGGYGDLVAFQSGMMWTGSAIVEYHDWVSFDADVDENETSMFTVDRDFTSADYAGGAVYAQDSQGWLYGIWYDDMVDGIMDLNATRIVRLSQVYNDMAYNYADGKLYGLYIDEDTLTSYVDAIDLEDDFQVDEAGSIDGVYGLGLACNDDGNLYLMGPSEEGGAATLYVGTPAEGEYHFDSLFDTELEMNYRQSMAWDHNTETLYWARIDNDGYCDLQEIDPEEETCEQVGVLSTDTYSMFAPLTDANAAKPAHNKVPDTSAANGTPVLVDTALSLAAGGSRQLAYDVTPWYADNVDMTWSSSDETVATVVDGLVTAVGAGTCTITVENTADSTLKDTCTVNVVALELTIDGTYSEMGANIMNVSDSYLYTYTIDGANSNMEQGAQIFNLYDLMYPGYGLGYGQKMVSAILIPDGWGDEYLWTCEWDNNGVIQMVDTGLEDPLYAGMINPYGLEPEYLGPIGGDALFGMAYSAETDRVTGIMNYDLFVDLPNFTNWAIAMAYGEDYDDVPDMDAMWDEEGYPNFDWHKLDLSEDLDASDEGFATGEAGDGSIVDVVLCGITDIGSAGPVTLTKDYLGGSTVSGSYTPDTTMVLLDNVGRLWYVDELMGMTKEGDTYTGDCGTVTGATGIHTWEYEDDCSVFVIREIVETPLYEMYWEGTMPRYTYQFSDIYYAGADDSDNAVYLLSLYDHHNAGTTNRLYLLVMDEDGGTLIELGDMGENNVIATIYDAEVDMGSLASLVAANAGSQDSDAVVDDDLLPLAVGHSYTR